MKEEFRRFLEEHGFLPLSDWECFDLHHAAPLSSEDERETFSKIRENVGKKVGVYIYEQKGEIICVGQGYLQGRIKQHYNEAIGKPRKGEKEKYYEFWRKHQGLVRVYWKELREEKIRKAIELMLSYVLEAEFEKVKRQYR